MNHRTCLLLVLTTCWLSGCAHTPWGRRVRGPLPPPAFAAQPQLPDIVYAVNANTNRVRQLQTNGARLEVAGVPMSLQADLAVERPRRFRLKAELLEFTGRELDVGSNDELFWLWVRRNPEPAIFYARHAQFASSPARQLVAVDPQWLIEAVGLTELDGTALHEGPFPAGEGKLEIRSRLPAAADGTRAEMTRVIVLDDTYAWILEQHVYDAQGQLLASVRAGDHRFYPSDGVSLPHQLRVDLAPNQPTQLSLVLNVRDYAINQLYGEPQQLWAMPRIDGAQPVDVADPRFVPQVVPTPPNSIPVSELWSQDSTARQAATDGMRGFR